MQGYIYKATSPSGKCYIGQTTDSIKNRWRDHGYDAFDCKKDHCKLLNKAIRKYGLHAFSLECVDTCTHDELDTKEQFYIKSFNTMKPDGYNIKEGGSSSKHTNETKDKIKQTLQGRKKSVTMRENLSKTKKAAIGSVVPQYVVHVRRNSEIIGYRVVNHPKQNGTEKRFTSTMMTLDEKLQRAIQYIQFLNTTEVNIQKQARTLPKHLQIYKHGYMVKYNDIRKYFLSKQKTNAELYENALEFLKTILPATHLDQGNP